MMMKLFYSPFHGFVHKSLVVLHETGLWDEIEFVPTFPFLNLDRELVGDAYSIADIAPLGTVPTLALDDGTVLYGSQVVVEYLDSINPGAKLYPETGSNRWDALRRLALGDAIFETSVRMSMESWLAAEERRQSLYEWQWPKIIRSLDALELEAASFDDFDIGHTAILQGITYCASWASRAEDLPVHPKFDWREGRQSLARWFDKAVERPSVTAHFNKDYDGDMSPEFHRRKVEEVLAAQKRKR